jgi:hypothetical protein
MEEIGIGIAKNIDLLKMKIKIQKNIIW